MPAMENVCDNLYRCEKLAKANKLVFEAKYYFKVSNGVIADFLEYNMRNCKNGTNVFKKLFCSSFNHQS